MPPSDTRSGIMTRTSTPALLNDSPSVSPSSTAMLRAVGPNRDVPQSAPAPVNSAGRGSPSLRSAEPRTPLGSPPGLEHSSPSSDSPRASVNATLRQQGAARDDWGNPAFIQEKVTSLDRRLSTVSGLVQQQVDNDKENNSYSYFSKLSEVAGEIKADLKRTQESIKEGVDASVEGKLAGLRQQITADGQEVLDGNVQALRQQIKADLEEIIQRSVTETLGAMSINMTQVVQDVAALNRDVGDIKTILQHVESTSANVADELNTSLTHVRWELGLPMTEEVTVGGVLDIALPPPVRDDGIVQLGHLQSGADVSTTPTIHGNTSVPDIPSADAAVAHSETVQSSAHIPITLGSDVPATPTKPDAPTTPTGPDVPTTPTAPETPTVSDASSVRTGRVSSFNEARTFLETLHGMAKLYSFIVRNKRRT